MPSRKVRLRKIAGGLRMRSRDNLIRLRESRLVPIGISDYRMLLLLPIMLGLIVLAALLRQTSMGKASFRPQEREAVAPLSGWVVHADTWGDTVLSDINLVYAEVTWAELESEKGVYDFEAFEEKNHLPEWWEDGKRLILRFVTDRPGEEGHKDIPEWLVEEMGGEMLAGTFYESAEGSGFSPDYSMLPMREAHRRVIEAIAERYDTHDGVAYVEIGSLGRNGEWVGEQSETGANLLPTSTVSREYTWHYTNAFSKTPMLMCRPYKEAELMNVGLFNPNMGDFEATWDYLESIEQGGYDSQIETDLVAMPDFYLTSPSGAHIPEELDLERLLTEGRSTLARQIAESRLEYVVIDASPASLSAEAIEELDEMEYLLGSRLWIRSARWDAYVHGTMRCTVYMTWRNDGLTPMHANWPLALALFDGEELVWVQTTELNASMMLPGDTELRAWIDIPHGVPKGTYTLKAAILDPSDGLPGVPLMMAECDGQTLWTELGEVNVISQTFFK